MTTSHLWPGVPFALASAALFGASTPLAKLLLGAVDPWLMAGILYLGAGLGLALVRPWSHRFGTAAVEAPLRRADLPWLAAVVLFGGVVGPVLLMLGTRPHRGGHLGAAAQPREPRHARDRMARVQGERRPSDRFRERPRSLPVRSSCRGRAVRSASTWAHSSSPAPACAGGSTTTCRASCRPPIRCRSR